MSVSLPAIRHRQIKKMQHKKLIIFGLIILLLIDLGLAYQSYQKGKTPAFETIEVKRGDIAEKVSVTGAVEPASQLDLQFTSSGKVSDVKVKVGDRVKAGRILVSLDASDLSFQAQAQAAALKNSEAKLAQLLAGASQEEITLAQTAVLSAENALNDAEKSLKDSEAGAQNSLTDVSGDWQRTLQASFLTSENSIKANAQVLDSSKISFISVADSQALIDAEGLRQNAENKYKTVKILIDQALLTVDENQIGAASSELKSLLSLLVSALSRTYDVLNSAIVSSSLSQTDLDAFKSDIVTARGNANTALTNDVSAEQDMSAQKITNQTNLTSAQAKVTSAQGSLKSSQDQLVLKQAKPRPADIDLKEAEVAQAQANLSQIRNQIAQKSLMAPIDGIITGVEIEKGEIASLGKTIISMNALSDFEIKSDIVESDIAKVKTGDSVSITFDALGESEAFSGKVIKIDPAQTVVSGVVYYRATIGLESQSEKVKSGMTANLEIETARRQNSLIIPARAIQEAGGKKNVKVLENGQIKEKEIKAGLKNDLGEVEILEGLREGEKIVIETK